MKPILFLLMSCLLAACIPDPLVRTEHDPAVAFGSYRSYAWKQQPPISNPLLKQRVVDAIEAELGGKGWRLVPEQDANILLVGNVSARDEQTIDAFYEAPDWNGWGWRGANAGDAVRRVEIHTYKVGTLVLDMFDAQSRKGVWRATAEGTVPASQARINENALAAVHAMFLGFPPPPSPPR